MTFVDLLIVLLFVAVTAVGFFQGTIRLIVALVTFYASIILASLYFRFLAIFFTRRGTSEQVASSLSFLIILILAFALLFTAGMYTFRYVHLSGRLDYLDKILGTLLGMVLATMVAVMLTMVLNYSFVRYDVAATVNFPLTSTFQRSVRASTVRPILLQHILPRIHAAIAPFLPEAALPLFQPN